MERGYKSKLIYKKCKSILQLLAFCMLFGGIKFSVHAAERYYWPVPSTTHTSREYWNNSSSSHLGVDIPAADGTAVFATKSGTIVKFYNSCNHYEVGSLSGCVHNGVYGAGNYVTVRHDDGTWAMYSHMQKNSFPANIYENARVVQGQFLGGIGSSGYSTGSHLHFAIRTGNANSFWSATPVNNSKNAIDYVYNYDYDGDAGGTSDNSTIFKETYVENVTQSSATIGVRLKSTYYATKGGFYFGTDPSNLTKKEETLNTNAVKIYYGTNKWVGALQSNMTYYYKLFVVVNGVEYITDLQSFRTTSAYSAMSIENISETNAVMKATLNEVFSLSKAGVYFGTNASKMQKVVESVNANAKWLTYDANKWIGTLNPGTTYYCQIYATIDGVEHKTDLLEFQTLDQTNPVINSAEIVSVTGSGYTVRCKASDNGHIQRVSFPTWTTANWQDDLVDNWKDNTAVYSPDSNGYYTFKVNISDHNNESGEYNTHVYVYDSVGNKVLKTLTCEVYPLTSISLSKSSIGLDEGASTTLSITYNPTNTTESKTVSWKSSNTSVAKVSSAGKVTAVSAGQATITATVAGKTASCTVTVKDGSEAQVKAFVERMYTVALGRSADASGVEYWTNLLLTGQQDGASLAQSFIFGDEFVKKNYTSQQYIDVLYKTFFNREADSSGSAYWLQLMNNRTSRKAVLAGFVNSQEFSELCSSYGISRGTLVVEDATVPDGIYSFVERLYICALERQGDSDGIGYWAQNIAAKGSTPEDVAKLFFLSNEYVAKNVSADKYIETLYITFMNRVCDASGKAYWINALNSGMTREGALTGFAQSAEFKAIMQSYGL